MRPQRTGEQMNEQIAKKLIELLRQKNIEPSADILKLREQIKAAMNIYPTAEVLTVVSTLIMGGE